MVPDHTLADVQGIQPGLASTTIGRVARLRQPGWYYPVEPLGTGGFLRLG